MPTVQLPVTWLHSRRPHALRCARHGESAVEVHRLRLVRGGPGTLARLRGAFAAAASVPSHPVLTPPWPFCGECRRERSLRLWVGAALSAAALVLLAGPAMAAPSGRIPGALPAAICGVLALVLLLGGLGAAIAGSWAVLSGAALSRDGRWLLIDADQRFADQLRRSSVTSRGSGSPRRGAETPERIGEPLRRGSALSPRDGARTAVRAARPQPIGS